MSMARASLVADLKASLQDAASVFTAASDADFVRHLDRAALDLGRRRPRTLLGEVTLVAEQAAYAAPGDMLAFKVDTWGQHGIQPWEDHYPGRLPQVRLVELAAAKVLAFSPAPTAAQIGILGASYGFYYLAAHAIGDAAADTTVADGDRGVLLLRAQAEACRELAMRGMTKPVALRDGHSGTPRNSTPSALWQALMDEFEAA